MTTQEMIEVLLAHERGETIEYRAAGESWRAVSSPLFNFSLHIYRVAKKRKFRPWTPEEAIGKKIRSEDSGALYVISQSDNCGVVVGGCTLPYSFILANYVQLDGSPCGVLE